MSLFLNYFLIIILISLFLPTKSLFTNSEFFMHEICSHNGIPTFDQSTKEIKCNCKPGFLTDNKVRMIKNQKVQCSYKQKNRMLSMFLSLLCPFGASFLYLEYYYVFAILFILISFGCCSSIVIEIRAEKDNQTSNKKNVVEKSSRIPDILSKVFSVYRYLIFAYWIIEFGLMCGGVFNDGNGFAVYNDLDFLYNVYK